MSKNIESTETSPSYIHLLREVRNYSSDIGCNTNTKDGAEGDGDGGEIYMPTTHQTRTYEADYTYVTQMKTTVVTRVDLEAICYTKIKGETRVQVQL